MSGAKGRLPTEAEWELAATGGDGRPFPWESEDAVTGICGTKANCDSFATMPVGSYSSFDDPYGLDDMAGNVVEWTADEFEAYEPDGSGSCWSEMDSGQDNPLCISGVIGISRVVRGGSWSDNPEDLRSAVRHSHGAASYVGNIGFRCARSAPL